MTTLRGFRGQRVKGNEFERLVDLVHHDLPGKMDREPVYESLTSLAGNLLTVGVLWEVACRLAGNVERLRSHVVPVWRKQHFDEWVPAQVSWVRLKKGGKKGREVGHDLAFEILAGTPAGHTARQWWSKRKSYYLAYHRDKQGNGFAFTRPTRAVIGATPSASPFEDPKLFTTLRCLVLVEKERSIEEPDFREVAFSSAMTTHNRLQHKRRARQKNIFECPEGYDEDYPCLDCWVGYENCPAAVHPYDYQRRECPGCKKETWHNPAAPGKLCVACTDALALKDDT